MNPRARRALFTVILFFSVCAVAGTVMQRRVGALLLSALPLGMGLLWAVFDEDHLGWHDRISGTYQRSYK